MLVVINVVSNEFALVVHLDVLCIVGVLDQLIFWLEVVWHLPRMVGGLLLVEVLVRQSFHTLPIFSFEVELTQNTASDVL